MHSYKLIYIPINAIVNCEKQLLQIEFELLQFFLLASTALANLFVVSFVAHYEVFSRLLTALDVLTDRTSYVF